MTPLETGHLSGGAYLWRNIRLVLALWCIELAMKLWPKQTNEDFVGQRDLIKAFFYAEQGTKRLRP